MNRKMPFIKNWIISRSYNICLDIANIVLQVVGFAMYAANHHLLHGNARLYRINLDLANRMARWIEAKPEFSNNEFFQLLRMKRIWKLEELDNENDQVFYSYNYQDYDLEFTLDFVGLKDEYRDQITGVVFMYINGEVDLVWLSESSAPFANNATYRPLPFYREPEFNWPWQHKYYPSYWQYQNYK